MKNGIIKYFVLIFADRHSPPH